MAKETKTSKKEIIEKIIKTVEVFIAPITTALAIWDLDAGVYVAAASGFIISGLRLVEVCIKD
jgi:hypothetical protein